MLVLMAYDDPAGANNFRYTIGWNLDAAGVSRPTGRPALSFPAWAGKARAPAWQSPAWRPIGAPTGVFMAYDAPAGPNGFRYQVVKNMRRPCL